VRRRRGTAVACPGAPGDATACTTGISRAFRETSIGRAASRSRVALSAAALALLPSAALAVCDQPRCMDVVVPVPHDLRVPDSTVRVLLPSGYEGARTRYPVLYLAGTSTAGSGRCADASIAPSPGSRWAASAR
jgi:hypothetical protein